MFNCVLKSLSTTEIVTISEELSNPDVRTESIVDQLISKSNSPIVIGNATMEEVRTKLTYEVLDELCVRAQDLIDSSYTSQKWFLK